MSKPKDFVGKAPFFQKWDEKAFQFDTMQMGWQARLLYKDLLQKAFHISTRPDLPSDDAQLCNVLGIPSAVWDEHRAVIRGMFTLDAATGLLWQKRLRHDWQDLYIYRREQTKRIDKRWADAKAKKTQPVDTTVLPANYHGNTSRVEKSREEKVYEESNRTDDAVPGASLGSVTPPFGESNPTANPTSPSAPADKENLCAELTAFVFNETSFQPPSPKSIRNLVDQYPMRVLKSAFQDAIWQKSKGDLLSTVKLFFQGGADGIILAAQQREFHDNLNWAVTHNSDDFDFEDFIKGMESDIPAGVEASIISGARKRRQQFVNSLKVKVQS